MFGLSLKEEINLCNSSGLTPTELLILRLLMLAIDGDASLLSDYLNVSKIDLRIILQSFKDKKVILASYVIPNKGEELKFKNIPFNKNFIKLFVRESNEIGKEFFDLYPMFITINGKNCSIKNITKGGFFSLEDFCLYYSKQIKACHTTHEQIMESLQYAIDNNLIHYSILEFVASQKWNEIEYIRNSGNVNGYNNSELI